MATSILPLSREGGDTTRRALSRYLTDIRQLRTNRLWERTLSQLETYDLARLNQDVLKGVYQELVDPKDRHDLGEYHTPDWLPARTDTSW